MSQQDKIFIGRCFNGNFQEGSADIKYLLDEEALMQLFDLMKEAKANRDSLPAGVTEYNGNLQINLRVRTNRAGDKSYSELDTWKPAPDAFATARAIEQSRQNPQKKTQSTLAKDLLPGFIEEMKRPLDPDDLPF